MQTVNNPVLNSIKQHLIADHSVFTYIRIGVSEVKRSQIPPVQKVTAYFDIDRDSYLTLSKTALDLNLTTDELLRRLTWAITSHG